MRKLLGLTTLLILASLPAMAQGTPTAEVGGGYTFRSYGLPSFEQPPSRISMNGWNVTGDYNFNQWLGAAVDVDWTTNTSGDPVNGFATTHISTAMIGPQIYPMGHHRLTPFVHGLFGAGRFYFNFPSAPFDFAEYDFAWAAGGGVDYTVTPHVAVRLGQLDYEQVHFGLQAFGNGAAAAQNNFKYSAGILFRF